MLYYNIKSGTTDQFYAARTAATSSRYAGHRPQIALSAYGRSATVLEELADRRATGELQHGTGDSGQDDDEGQQEQGAERRLGQKECATLSALLLPATAIRLRLAATKP